jgi:hypothetical protein
MRASEPLTNTGTAPSCRSANALMNGRDWIIRHIDLQQCVGHEAERPGIQCLALGLKLYLQPKLSALCRVPDMAYLAITAPASASIGD